MELLLIVAVAVGVFWWVFLRAKPKDPLPSTDAELRPLRLAPSPPPQRASTTVEVAVRQPTLPSGIEAQILAALKAGGDPDEEWMRGDPSDDGRIRLMPWQGQFKSVAGETFKNPDGVSRQTILSHAEPGAGVYLVAEPTNQHDPDAVAVYLDAGGGATAQIGYLPRDHGMSGDIASGSVLAWLARVAQRNPTSPLGAVLYVVVRNGPAPVATNATPPARAPSGGLGVSGCIAVVVVVGGTLYFYAFDVFVPKQASEASNWSAPAPRAAADPYDQTGCSASKRAIGDKLKSPGSAKWVSCQVTTEAGVQNVRLVVDSQNASGGLVRTEWMTRVRNNNVESVDQFR